MAQNRHMANMATKYIATNMAKWYAKSISDKNEAIQALNRFDPIHFSQVMANIVKYGVFRPFSFV